MTASRYPTASALRSWNGGCPTPFSMKYEKHREVRDEIERLVMNLILKLRSEQRAPRFRGQGSGRLKI